jgi:hypothetical protein
MLILEISKITKETGRIEKMERSYNSMNKGELVQHLQEHGMMQEIQSFDYALPQGGLDILTIACKNSRFLEFREMEEKDIYSSILFRFVFAYTPGGIGDFYLIYPDLLGQRILSVYSNDADMESANQIYRERCIR